MAPTKEQITKLQGQFFCMAILELLKSLAPRFISNSKLLVDIERQIAMVEVLKQQPLEIILRAIQLWKYGTESNYSGKPEEIGWIKRRDPAPLLSYAKQNPSTPIIGQLDFEYLLVHPENADVREPIWARLENITNIAQSPENYPGLGVPPLSKSPFNGSPPATTEQNVATTPIFSPGTATQPPVMDAKRMVDTVKANIPMAMQVFKELMANKGDDNPLVSMLQMIKDPKKVNGDIASNLMGLAGEMGIDRSVLEQTDDEDMDSVSVRMDALETDVGEMKNSLKSIEKMLKKAMAPTE